MRSINFKDIIKPLHSLSYRFYRWLFKERIEAIIFFVAFTTQMSIGLYFVYRWGVTYTSMEDCLAHLYIARSIIDNGANSGLLQLGTVWLPVYHLLLVPFVAIDVLYMTGLAGTIVNGLMVAGISVMIYRLLDDTKTGVLASLLFLFNPYTLFLYGSSIWMPPAGMFFALLAIYYFKLYLRKNELNEFMKCSLTLIIGTMTRYEVWPISILVVIFFTMREIKKGQSYRIAYVHIPLWGIFGWFFYNLAIFRDPFIWIRGPFPGASGFYGGVINSILNPSMSQLLSFGFPSMIMLSGYIWIFLPITSLLSLLRKNWDQLVTIILLCAPLILIFVVGTVYHRQEVSKLYFSLPAIIISCFLITKFVKNSSNAHIIKILLIICLMFLYSLTLPYKYTHLMANPSPYYSQNSEIIEYYSKIKDEALLIKNIIGQGSYILASSRGSRSSARLLSVIGGISPSKIIDEFDGSLFSKASKEPWKYSTYVIVDKTVDRSSIEVQNNYYGSHFLYLFHYDLEWRSEFLEYYQLTLEAENYFVYQLRRSLN